MDLVEKPQPDHSAPFTKMAEDITRNASTTFGGAAVLVPPGDGDTAEMLFLSQDSPVIFWASLKSLVEQRLNELDALQRGTGAGLRR